MSIELKGISIPDRGLLVGIANSQMTPLGYTGRTIRLRSRSNVNTAAIAESTSLFSNVHLLRYTESCFKTSSRMLCIPGVRIDVGSLD